MIFRGRDLATPGDRGRFFLVSGLVGVGAISKTKRAHRHDGRVFWLLSVSSWAQYVPITVIQLLCAQPGKQHHRHVCGGGHTTYLWLLLRKYLPGTRTAAFERNSLALLEFGDEAIVAL